MSDTATAVVPEFIGMSDIKAIDPSTNHTNVGLVTNMSLVGFTGTIATALNLPPELVVFEACFAKIPSGYNEKPQLTGSEKKIYSIGNKNAYYHKEIQGKIKPLDVKIVSITSYFSSLPSRNIDNHYHSHEVFRTQPDARFGYGYGGGFNKTKSGERRLLVVLDINGIHVPFIQTINQAEKLFDLSVNEDGNLTKGSEVLGDIKKDIEWAAAQATHHDEKNRSVEKLFDGSIRSINGFSGNIGVRKKESLNNIINYATKNGLIKLGLSAIDWNNVPEGVSKVYKKILPFAKALFVTDPVGVAIFYDFAFSAKKTYESVKLSVVFNAIFEKVETQADFEKACKPFFDYYDSADRSRYGFDITHLLTEHPSYKEGRKKAIKSNGNRAFNKLMQEAESLNIDEKKFPKIFKLIQDGEIPISTFFRKSEQYFLLNDNWPLWEEMIKRGHKDSVIELAKEVAKRSTYEKDLMSYFYFILYSLPEYLKKHTGKKWTCSPRLVESESELEPPKEDDATGITRKRSALTPIVDNDACTVVVPYASLQISGRQTTYCYSHDYHILTKGFSFHGNACVTDLEEKLNGRDDYGLMFYTLTGSAQQRGYPTFLIIFERRQSGAHVHFHRVHPSRSKDGDYNPIHNWTKVCYNYMAGNVRKDNIKYQQGDLIFVAMTEEQEKLQDFSKYVEKYDNHMFDKPVGFAAYTKKERSNILGYVRLIDDVTLKHHEHEHVPMKAGAYEIRQCRSWEANPKGVWSLRID